MAIAYYIPDQAKLLAGRQNTHGNNNNSRNSTTSQNSLRLQQTARGTTETANSNPADNRGCGTTINITVPTYTTTAATPQEPLGCWEFLTQVFCHALRFYHESSQLQPTVIQISVNFNANMPATNATTTTTVNTTTADSTATTTISSTPTASYTAANEENINHTDQKQLKFSKRKN